MKVQELIEKNLLDHIEFQNEEEKEEFLSEYGEILFSRIIERVSAVLDENQTRAISQEMDQDASLNQILESLVRYVPHLPIIIGEEVLDMKEESLQLLQIA